MNSKRFALIAAAVLAVPAFAACSDDTEDPGDGITDTIDDAIDDLTDNS